MKPSERPELTTRLSRFRHDDVQPRAQLAHGGVDAPGQAGDARIERHPGPDGEGASGPASITRPAISWPSTKGKVPMPISVGDGPVLWAKRWRSLPQIPPVATSTRAHDGPGSVGLGQLDQRCREGGIGHVELDGAHAAQRSGDAGAGRTRTGAAAPDLQCAPCGFPTPPSTRCATRGFSSSRVPRSPTSSPRPKRRCGCTSRDPRTTSPTRAGLTAHWPRASSPASRSSPTARGTSTASPSTPTSSTRPSGTSGRTELHLYKVELWAKYAGAVNYDQPLHRDYGSHSLVVPRPETRYQQITTFIYLSDVTEEDGPTVIVPYDDGKDVPFTPLYFPSVRSPTGRCAASDRRARCSMYRTDILHRGSDFAAPGRSRFSLLADYQVRGTTWGGKMAWPKQSPERWAKLIPQCTVRQRDLFGFPRPGDPYWNDATLEGVAARYPGIDLEPIPRRRRAPG